MFISFLISLLVSMIITWLAARALFRLNIKKSQALSKKDRYLNAVICGLVFFCVSCFIYALLINSVFH
ncbi:hypothetical protein [Cysteiniphilum halobium]|uniref:hypothetical protein n=1 Tax=Cysteiniphilum halobium TaxID=2219059 RepID=UPI000E65B1E7|nr:hypothetical protein [Cysteiniphilum halobium]